MSITPPRAKRRLKIRFIGSAGIPNRYGGFESFLEHCAPVMAAQGHEVKVTCDGNLYGDRVLRFHDVERIFLSVSANGGWSLLHDLLAFAKSFRGATHVVVLGVSGGFWFPIFRLACDLTGARLLVNIDGVEWRRSKFGRGKRALLKVLDLLAQRFAHTVIYDNVALSPYLLESAKSKAFCIPYSGDHVLRLEGVRSAPSTALTICRIEPENNLEMLIEGALLSKLRRYTIVGNWNHSPYSRQLRERYAHEERLVLLDPIYDAERLAHLRESCGMYLHGHSVGGTNPSLVEMLFYDCCIFCFDVAFNREAAGDAAGYFRDAASLALLIDHEIERTHADRDVSRFAVRRRFTAKAIAHAYIMAMNGGT